MKILLTAVNAKYIHSNPALYSLKAYAHSRGVGAGTEIAEFTINQPVDEIAAAIYEKNPDVLAFSCYIWNVEIIEKLILMLAHVLDCCPVWLGGPEVSYESVRFLKEHPSVKGILYGEGEAAFAELAAYYESGAGSLEKIRGLVFRDGKRIVQTPPGERPDLDDLPFLYSDLSGFEHRILYYESSRGCPFSCSYCLSSIDKSARFRGTEKVKEELQFFLDRNAAQVKFVDRTFNCRHSHALAVWRYLKEHDNGITNFHFEIAADLLTEEELALLNTLRPGQVQMEIGVQSTNRRTLCEIRRVSDFERLKETVRRLQEGGNIHLHLDLIAGLPYETYGRFIRSFNEVYELRPQQLQLGFLKVLKGSEMYREAEKYGLRYRPFPPYEVLCTRWISYAKLLRLKAVEEMVEIYYNSGQFAHTIRYLEREFAHPYEMFEKLAQFCRTKGNAGQKQSRLARLEQLRAFIGSRTQDPVYDDLLLFDLYLRENAKSRPVWARDPAKDKDAVLEFFRREETEHRFLKDCAGRSAKQLMYMAHLERFDYCVPDGTKRQERWLLFDYRQRNPLTGDAFVQDVTKIMKTILDRFIKMT